MKFKCRKYFLGISIFRSFISLLSDSNFYWLISELNGFRKLSYSIKSTLILPTSIGLLTRNGRWFLSSDTQTVIFSPPSKIVPCISSGTILIELYVPILVSICSFPIYLIYNEYNLLSKNILKG